MNRRSCQFAAILLGLIAIGVTVWIVESELTRSPVQLSVGVEGKEVAGEWLAGGVISSDRLQFLKLPTHFRVVVSRQGSAAEVEWGTIIETWKTLGGVLIVSESPPKLIDDPHLRWVELPPEIGILAATREAFSENWKSIQAWTEHPELTWQDLPPLPWR